MAGRTTPWCWTKSGRPATPAPSWETGGSCPPIRRSWAASLAGAAGRRSERRGRGESVRRETGLRPVFHHLCPGYVEAHGELALLLDLTDPDLLGLCLDSG